MFYSIGSVIIDDIVLPDGETRMGVLGGGATHAAIGMRVWSERVGVCAAIGHNFPESARAELAAAFDLRGLLERDAPTPRAWQLFERDGRRTEVFRTDFDRFVAISPQPAELAGVLRDAEGAHLECGAPEPFGEWVRVLRAGGCKLILWEPWDLFCKPENLPLFSQLAPLVDVVSPNLLEARQLTGEHEPEAITAALLARGAKIVALRMGELGSLVAAPDMLPTAVPAVVGKLVDVTGAGNAYCGGLLVGLAETGDPEQAGRYGAVAASFALEQFGAVFSLDNVRERAKGRLHANPRRVVFDRLAPAWDTMPAPPGLDAKLARIAAAGNLASGDRVLDLGAGTGALIPALLQHRPALILAADLSPAMLFRLREKLGGRSEVRAFAADGGRLPLADDSVDAVLCHAVFPHFSDRRGALVELGRVARPGGRIVISHAVGRERVNAVHRGASDAILRGDILPPADEVAAQLSGLGWRVVETVDDEGLFLLVAEKS